MPTTISLPAPIEHPTTKVQVLALTLSEPLAGDLLSVPLQRALSLRDRARIGASLWDPSLAREVADRWLRTLPLGVLQSLASAGDAPLAEYVAAEAAAVEQFERPDPAGVTVSLSRHYALPGMEGASAAERAGARPRQRPDLEQQL